MSVSLGGTISFSEVQHCPNSRNRALDAGYHTNEMISMEEAYL
jgi:hypothetical protein